MAGITRAEVAHLARLARIAMTDDELDHMSAQLDQILVAVARVSEAVDASDEDIPPTSHAVPLTNVFRRDEVRPSLPRDAVLAGAPDAEDDRFRVPRILDEES